MNLWEWYKTLTCYLLQLPEDTRKSSVQIFKEWQRQYHYPVDAATAPVLLEYIESAKHENRKFLLEAAKLDHFVN